MIARYGFRWILPVVMVAVSLCIFGLGIATEQPVTHIMTSSQSATQDGETVSFNMPPEPKTDFLVLTAMLLNFPAFYLGIIVAALLGAPNDSVLFALATVFASVLWYLIGRWIDRQRMRDGPPKPGPVRDTLRGFARILVALLLLLCIWILPHAFAHHEWNRYFLAGFTLWCATYLASSFWGGWREKRRIETAS